MNNLNGMKTKTVEKPVLDYLSFFHFRKIETFSTISTTIGNHFVKDFFIYFILFLMLLTGNIL